MIAHSSSASSPLFDGETVLSDAWEPANPPDLGSGEARRDTGASDHFAFRKEDSTLSIQHEWRARPAKPSRICNVPSTFFNVSFLCEVK